MQQLILRTSYTGPGKSTALLSAFRNGLSAFSAVPAGMEMAESEKYIDVSGKWSCYFT